MDPIAVYPGGRNPIHRGGSPELSRITPSRGARFADRPYYAGLGDSSLALGKAGVSRLQSVNVLTVGTLGPEECGSYVKQMLGLCRIPMTSDELDEAATGIAKSSDGLPQHPIYETVVLFWGLSKRITIGPRWILRRSRAVPPVTGKIVVGPGRVRRRKNA